MQGPREHDVRGDSLADIAPVRVWFKGVWERRASEQFGIALHGQVRPVDRPFPCVVHACYNALPEPDLLTGDSPVYAGWLDERAGCWWVLRFELLHTSIWEPMYAVRMDTAWCPELMRAGREQW